jgi:hypothetical protein
LRERIIMDWLNELLGREDMLRRHLADIRAAGEERSEGGSGAEERFRRSVEPEVQAIDSLLEDYLCGRTEDECARMRFVARLRLPVYSHLRSLLLPVSSATR